jgi:hypothetical protein
MNPMEIEMTKLTNNEIKALQGILKSDFMDGATEAKDVVNKPVWTWSANTFENKRTYSGVVASLVKKGLVVCSDMGTEDACLQMTQEGFDALQRGV